MRLVGGRLAAVSVRASFGAGAWVGGALGLVIGALLGALLCWFAGALLDWQREAAFTLGVAQALLPLGGQIGALRWLSANWLIVVPAAGLGMGLFAGLVGGLIGGLLAAAYNRSPRHASVVVELPDEPDDLTELLEPHEVATEADTSGAGSTTVEPG